MAKNKFIKEEESEPKGYKNSNSVVELSDWIEYMLDNKGRGKPTKEWKNEINYYIDRANTLAKHKIYNRIQ